MVEACIVGQVRGGIVEHLDLSVHPLTAQLDIGMTAVILMGPLQI